MIKKRCPHCQSTNVGISIESGSLRHWETEEETKKLEQYNKERDEYNKLFNFLFRRRKIPVPKRPIIALRPTGKPVMDGMSYCEDCNSLYGTAEAVLYDDTALSQKDLDFIWGLMPAWIKKEEPGLCPTMYGTGSYEGDKEVIKKVKNILRIKSET